MAELSGGSGPEFGAGTLPNFLVRKRKQIKLSCHVEFKECWGAKPRLRFCHLSRDPFHGELGPRRRQQGYCFASATISGRRPAIDIRKAQPSRIRNNG